MKSYTQEELNAMSPRKRAKIHRKMLKSRWLPVHEKHTSRKRTTDELLNDERIWK